MKTKILSYLLHHANRISRSEEFYTIKDAILKKYARLDGYDVQKFDGKVCYSCDGRGDHPLYSNRPPYKPYDYRECYRCSGTGYYQLPRWVCLGVYRFGKYTFHRPLKSEWQFTNPFTKEELGWEVTEKPVIKGYIEHEHSNFGYNAMMILFLIYNRKEFMRRFANIIVDKKLRLKRKLSRLLNWQTYIFWKPVGRVQYEYEINDDLPF